MHKGGPRPSSGANAPHTGMFASGEGEDEGGRSSGGRHSKSPGGGGRSRHVKSPGRLIGSATAAASTPLVVPRIRIEALSGRADATEILSPRGGMGIDILSPRSAFASETSADA